MPVDVDAACRDVGRDESLQLAGAERVEHALALVLRLVAVDGFCRDAVLREVARNLVGAVLGAREDERLALLVAQRLHEKRGLADAFDEDDALRHALGGRCDRRDRDTRRIAQHVRREVGDLARHRGGEQERLALLGKLRDDLCGCRG